MDKVVKWDKFEFQLKDFNSAHANGGRLEKFWVVDRLSNRQFLIKANTFLGYESISEKIAYIIGKNLGLDVLWYDIVPAKVFEPLIGKQLFSKYYSICEKIDRRECYITSVAEVKRARNVVRDKNDYSITNKEVMNELIPKSNLDKMILFDAIIGNKDRHYGNVHLLRKMDGTFITAPLLDNGASLLAITSFYKFWLPLGFYSLNEKENEASMTYNNHDEQITVVSTMKHVSFNIPVITIKILNDIEPTLQLISKRRAERIRRYIVYRLHKYLGYIKYQSRSHIYNREMSTPNEKEHT